MPSGEKASRQKNPSLRTRSGMTETIGSRRYERLKRSSLIASEFDTCPPTRFVA